ACIILETEVPEGLVDDVCWDTIEGLCDVRLENVEGPFVGAGMADCRLGCVQLVSAVSPPAGTALRVHEDTYFFCVAVDTVSNNTREYLVQRVQEGDWAEVGYVCHGSSFERGCDPSLRPSCREMLCSHDWTKQVGEVGGPELSLFRILSVLEEF